MLEDQGDRQTRRQKGDAPVGEIDRQVTEMLKALEGNPLALQRNVGGDKEPRQRQDSEGEQTPPDPDSGPALEETAAQGKERTAGGETQKGHADDQENGVIPDQVGEDPGQGDLSGQDSG